MTYYFCPHLNAQVELTDERLIHIGERHPDLIPTYATHIGKTIQQPDEIRRSQRFADARLFTRWFDDVRRGKYIVVVVVSEKEQSRHWVVTAYIARRLSKGTVEWKRN